MGVDEVYEEDGRETGSSDWRCLMKREGHGGPKPRTGHLLGCLLTSFFFPTNLIQFGDLGLTVPVEVNRPGSRLPVTRDREGGQTPSSGRETRSPDLHYCSADDDWVFNDVGGSTKDGGCGNIYQSNVYWKEFNGINLNTVDEGQLWDCLVPVPLVSYFRQSFFQSSKCVEYPHLRGSF